MCHTDRVWRASQSALEVAESALDSLLLLVFHGSSDVEYKNINLLTPTPFLSHHHSHILVAPLNIDSSYIQNAWPSSWIHCSQLHRRDHSVSVASSLRRRPRQRAALALTSPNIRIALLTSNLASFLPVAVSSTSTSTSVTRGESSSRTLMTSLPFAPPSSERWHARSPSSRSAVSR